MPGRSSLSPPAPSASQCTHSLPDQPPPIPSVSRTACGQHIGRQCPSVSETALDRDPRRNRAGDRRVQIYDPCRGSTGTRYRVVATRGLAGRGAPEPTAPPPGRKAAVVLDPVGLLLGVPLAPVGG